MPQVTSLAESLAKQYVDARRASEELCRPLVTEDYVLQAMPDVSPAKWHLAHVSWFFETFLLKPNLEGYRTPHPMYEVLFNSYYNGVGPQFFRPHRGLLSRPTVDEIYRYRRHVDDGMLALLETASHERLERLSDLIVLGVNHEQQHQELLLTDIKYNLWANPLRPAYRDGTLPRGSTPRLEWVDRDGGVVRVGHGTEGFAFDNEVPQHDELLRPHALASRPVTCGEFAAFIDDGGYERPELWLSEGWAMVREEGWSHPLYWEWTDGDWRVFTLAGMQPLDVEAPVCHLSYLEADAFARWAGKRLPTEFEWEAAGAEQPIAGNFVESGVLHPVVGSEADGGNGPFRQLYGDVWEWTQSAYLPYPGFQPAPGAVGEYNGKFMIGQMVLRGGSCVTPRSHIRATYRNFFHPKDRWQFMGCRLATDA